MPSDFDSRSPRSGPDVGVLPQLWADQFRHLTTLGIAGAGGVLVLMQAQLLDRGWRVALALFLLSASIAMIGQVVVVDEASEGRLPRKKGRPLRNGALAFLGAGAGFLFALLR